MPLKTSKLCQSFPEIMRESSSMLDYFIQYMESVNALHLVQFWLTVESFKAQNHPLGENARPVNSDTDKVGSGSPSDTSNANKARCDMTTTARTSKAVTGPDEAVREDTSVGGARHNVLRRRDTENHKYCNCGISMYHATPPLTPKLGSRTDLDEPNSETILKKDSEYPSPRLKRNSSMHMPLTDTFESKDQSKNLMTPDVLSSSSDVSQPKHCLPDVLGLTDRTQEAPLLKDPLPDSFTPSLDLIPDSPPKQLSLASGDATPLDLIPDSPPKQLSLASGDATRNAHTSNHVHHSAHLTDALGIYSKYLALNATNPVRVTNQIRQRVEVSICPEDGVISHTCFDEVQEFVYETMEKRYYPGFLHSSYLCKYQLDYIASGALNLVDFLLGENALSFFVEFMEQESASSLLQFWLTAENFYNQLSRRPKHSSTDVGADVSDAIAIYNRYFSLQATAPLHMEDSVRVDVENRICDEQGPRADSYLRPQLVAFHTMNEVYFPVFIGSSVYLRFLNELVQMLNKDDESTAAGRESRSGAYKASSLTVLKLSHFIMGKDLDDPDSLWERPAFLFRLGFVDEFGEYISEIDPVPIKSSRKDHSWTVSALILRKHRKEEELAMKLAKNIIKEVVNCITSDKA